MYLIDNKGLLFRYVYNGIEKKYFCVTKDKNKVSEGFIQSYDFYKKEIPIDDPKIEEIFDVKFYVYWDCKIKGVVDKKWGIHTSDYFSDGTVKIYHEGTLPGWRFEEKGLCAYFLEKEQIEGCSVKYKYVVKDGKKLDEPLEIEKEISVEEFCKIIEEYQNP